MINLKKVLIVLILFFCGGEFVFADEVDVDCSDTLRKGSTGTNVEILQKKLNEYMDCSLETDGIFGNKTYACVVKFQDRYNLNPDGIVGKKTCKKLNSNLEIIEDEKTSISDGNYIAVTSDNVDIRRGISEDTRVVEEASMGDIYSYEKVVNINGGSWYKLILDDGYGYISVEDAAKRFILLDISEQRLIYFKNKRVILDTNVVTGLKGENDTPDGHYMLYVANKELDRTLRGYNDDGSIDYESPVDYWMPFITSRGIGFHDASWRSEDEFNDSTYIYNGSHGCVNMRHEDAKLLYNKLNKDTDVIVKE